MQVTLHSSPCIPGVFLYCFGHRKKTKFSTKSPWKYAILTPKIFKKNLPPGPSPCEERMWGRDIPNPTLLGAFGARSWPLNFNSWIRLFEHGIICIASIHSMPGQCMGTLGRLSVEYYYSLSLLRRSHHSRLIRQVLTSLRFDLCTALHGRSAKSAAILPRHPHMHPPAKSVITRRRWMSPILFFPICLYSLSCTIVGQNWVGGKYLLPPGVIF